MPNRTYTPHHTPPSLSDRVLKHPFELTWAGLLLVSGLVLMADGLAEALGRLDLLTASSALAHPWWGATTALGAVMLIGAANIAHGLLRDDADESKDWSRERYGLGAGVVAALGYGVVVLMESPRSILSWLIPLIMAVPCVIRIIATYREEVARREVVRWWRDTTGRDA